MKTYQLYIGSNNQTGELEKERITEIASLFVEGFTLSEAVGFWAGSREKTAILTISLGLKSSEAEEALVLALAKELKEDLRQDAIAMQVLPPFKFI